MMRTAPVPVLAVATIAAAAAHAQPAAPAAASPPMPADHRPLTRFEPALFTAGT